ncbi:MAG TPA: SMC-Scp complex subunit ScpB [Acidobacteriaceae bacterium]|jgi:segregation and condensation protein B|nr:SMC-Scp complex subunit ScpB [Acidobacteriaceae bacterium]
MSLKARIEAVIYAAEDPVTLAQLASLFRDEALASRAARIVATADASTPTEEETEAIADDLLPSAENSGQDSGEPSEAAPQNSGEAEVATPDLDGRLQPVPEPPELTANSSISGEPTPSTTEHADIEKRAARQLDREIREEIRAVVDELIAEYNSPDRGLEIREVAGGFRIGTRPEVHDAVRTFVKSLKPPLKLSLQALETLAVIAYKQPVTAPEIGEIRGVDSGGVLGSLVARKLITTAGRKQVIGRPILYKTTREFLLRFGLKDLNELPSIEEFEKMAADLEASEAEAESGAVATEEELPFAQNEIAEIEEAENPEAEMTGPHDPKEPAPPMNDPEPEVPEPPIGEPPAEPEPAPTSERDAATVEEQHS